MKLIAVAFALLLLGLVFTTACKKDDPPAKNINSLTLLVNDTLYKADSVKRFGSVNKEFIAGYLPNNFVVGITVPDTTGFFEVGDTIKNYYVSYAFDVNNSFVSINSDTLGYINYTQLTPDVVRGTFQCHLKNPFGLGIKKVRSGTFVWYSHE